MPPLLLLIQILIGGITDILEQQTNQTAQDVGKDFAFGNAVVLAILRKNAELQGIVIDWADPAAVAAYVTTLPVYIPIPPPAALPAA